MTSAQCDTKNAFGRRKIEANFSFDSFLSRSTLLSCYYYRAPFQEKGGSNFVRKRKNSSHSSSNGKTYFGEC